MPHGRLKLREFADGSAELIHYHRADTPDAKLSDYRRVPVPDAAALREALERALRCARPRAQAALAAAGGLRRASTSTASTALGDFIELEVVLRDEQSEADGVRIAEQLMHELGLARAERIAGAYLDLLALTPCSLRSLPRARQCPGRAHCLSLLDVNDLRVTLNTARGPADALRGVSFAIDRGETVGLIGESGCGKSITALALMGLLPEGAIVTGSIRLDGRELVEPVRRRVVPAARAAHGHGVPGADDGAQPAAHRGPPDRRAAAPAPGSEPRARPARARCSLLERVRVPQAARRLDAYPHQLSGGQRQRVVIAIALACGPDLLIADEPTTALDVTVQREVLDLIGELVAERGMGLLLISHNLGVMARTVRRLMVMYGGIVAEAGPPTACSRAWRIPTRARCSRRVRASGWRAARGCRRFPGRVPELADLPKGCPFADRCTRVVDECRVAIPPALPVSAPGRSEALTNRSAQREGPPVSPAHRRALHPDARRARGRACLSRWSRPSTSAATTGCRARRCSARRRWCARSTT